jgi:hypothetical protein
MLLGDDVPADREAEPGALAGRLGGEERLEQFVPDLGRDAGAVVAHPDLDRVAEIARRHLQHRPEVGRDAVALALGGGVEAVAEEVEQHPRHLLRRQLDRGDGRSEITLQRDVEVLVLGAGAVIGEVQRFFDKRIEIDLTALAAAAARMLEHALDDAIGAPPVLGDLFEIAGQRRDNFVDIGAFVFRQPGDRRCGGLLQLVKQFDRQARKVVDEIERVIDLVGDSGGQLAQ